MQKIDTMNKELLIRSSSNNVDFALLKDGKLIEFHKDNDNTKFLVGDIYLAKIRKTMPALNAAFVNVGYKKDAFLHYHDLGPKVSSFQSFIKGVGSGKIKNFSLNNYKFEDEIDKNGAISEVLSPNQSVLIQIVKEPISTKGPRVTSELSIAGRFLVLVPFSTRISISQKIEDSNEKDRLKRLVKSITPKGFGVIIRTVAKGKKVAELDKDLQNLYARWIAMCRKIRNVNIPGKVMDEMNISSKILRDLFDESFTSILVDDEALHIQIKDYIQKIDPKKESIVKLYKSKIPIFEKFGIERQIKTSFGKNVSMTKGSYLVIEHTEALHVIDVNSGNRKSSAKNQEESALEVNLIAASEIARQLRLRDMGGIIVVDFIDQNRAENRKKLFNHLKSEMQEDRAKHKILPPSKFGLIQITRQRVRPEMNIKTREKNPSNNNGNEVEAPIVLINKISEDINRLINMGKSNIHLNIHPFIAAYIEKGYPSIRLGWYFKHQKWIKIIPRDAYKYLEYRFLDENGKSI
jgi:ribonuclease G|tara:strand:+ start:194 stop:1753 length:1560 start_codon:yes stop_codon:yes gene_type:complete